MNSAVYHLADAIGDLSKQLSKNIPKQYEQILKEYVSHHTVNLGFAIGWFIFFLIVVIISAVVLYKSFKQYEEQGLTLVLEKKLWISGITLVISAVVLVATIFIIQANIRDIVAPDYNMLYDIFDNIVNANKD